MTRRSLHEAQQWVDQGSAVLLRALGTLTDSDLTAPSGLNGWSRRHLLAHLALNAEALGRLATWARTGVRHDMYASPDQREADIQSCSRRSAPELRDWVARSAAELSRAWDGLSSTQWESEVITGQGRSLPARELPWLRAREACVHSLDLDAGATPDEIPPGFWAALVEDIAAWHGARGHAPTLDLRASDSEDRWCVDGVGPRVVVTAPTHELAMWLAGRTQAAGGPRLPRWL